MLKKKAKKMASPMGFDGGHSPTCRSEAKATLGKVSNPNFCKTQKLPKQKEKATAGKLVF